MYYIKKYWFLGIVGLVVAIVVFQSASNEEGTVTLQEEHPLVREPKMETSSTKTEQVVVDIKGAVHRPGIYEGTPNMRVHEIVSLAGGFTDDADETSVNLAQKIEDEMVVLVSFLQVTEGGTSGEATSDKVRINHATLEEITVINGIGPSKAEAIIAYREENGMFKEMEDLLEVSGIGEKTLENMREDIQIP
ncbi:helix-hairpin-helix domain-containing protein [Salimicrobium halophilum]|uniref:Competence protein ComEA n=1 Tax=Salimicrobium halophilum TaxID=86666 RepID=A0A1G8PNP6_9BACI|nr:helix-hairpin-helix domain-containing protein [Salimicrobium halophilum]SDI94171.1 competence protein ComEA [Salimicrobium halophilum]